MSKLTKITAMLAGFFALDKALAILRQVIIGRQFGLSGELDVFNVANNMPDLLFALISGGALAMAFIPVLSDVLTQEGRAAAWKLFSRIANLAFVVSAGTALLVALFAPQLIRMELGIAPGFTAPQQALTVELMRMDLIAMLIFSISGLIMAGLQANQHFFLPALAPLFYNIGQIFGATILAPSEGYQIGGIELPSYGLGIHGLVYGVILGALLHLAIQIPGLIKYKFNWTVGFGLRDSAVKEVLRLMGPRLLTMFFVQLIFLVRDNLASRLAEGAVSALSYGYMFQQVPETLIGTAIGTALLPTLSEQISKKDYQAFRSTVNRTINVLISLTMPIAAIASFALRPLLVVAFDFDDAGTDLLLWVTRGYFVGLTGHCLLEMAARSFYAQHEAKKPLYAAMINVGLYILFGSLFYKLWGAAGISLTDSLAFTVQALVLLFWLKRYIRYRIEVGKSLMRAVIASVLSSGLILLILHFGSESLSPLMLGLLSGFAGIAIAAPLVWKDIKLAFRL
ncbi:MAG: murein biosynthesis integral membrane protein MurJ [Anaerolineaceae bacterium]|nr:murein biosynthesis integral membrane protein MurJ [Anaerolineaceae bacterium]